MSRIETVVHQAQNAARTQLTRGAAAVRRETSIVNVAAKTLGQAQTTVAANIKKSGVYTKGGPDGRQYIEADTAYATARSVPVFDIKSPGKQREGARRSPMQGIRTPAGYYRRLALRVTGGVLLTGVIVAAMIALLHYWGY